LHVTENFASISRRCRLLRMSNPTQYFVVRAVSHSRLLKGKKLAAGQAAYRNLSGPQKNEFHRSSKKIKKNWTLWELNPRPFIDNALQHAKRKSYLSKLVLNITIWETFFIPPRPSAHHS
jgi:hypothetical protein